MRSLRALEKEGSSGSRTAEACMIFSTRAGRFWGGTNKPFPHTRKTMAVNAGDQAFPKHKASDVILRLDRTCWLSCSPEDLRVGRLYAGSQRTQQLMKNHKTSLHLKHEHPSIKARHGARTIKDKWAVIRGSTAAGPHSENTRRYLTNVTDHQLGPDWYFTS